MEPMNLFLFLFKNILPTFKIKSKSDKSINNIIVLPWKMLTNFVIIYRINFLLFDLNWRNTPHESESCSCL